MTEKIDTKELEEAILKLNDLHPFWGLDAELKAIFEPLIKHARAHLEAAPVLDEIENAQIQFENVANFLRGMCLDPDLPNEFKTHIMGQVSKLDKAANALQKLIERKG